MSFVTITEKKLTTAFVKGKASALLEEGLSERHVSRRVDIPRKTIAIWRVLQKCWIRSQAEDVLSIRSVDSASCEGGSNSFLEGGEELSSRTDDFRPNCATSVAGREFQKSKEAIYARTDRHPQAHATRLGNAALPLAHSMGSSRLD